MLSKWVENTVGKGEIAPYEQFLLFPQCFQKACFLRASKGVTVWEWVNNTISTSNNPERGFFRKHSGKTRKCWLPAFSPFPTMFSTLPKTKFQFFILHLFCCLRMLSIWTSLRFLSFGKDLTHSHTVTPFDAPGKQAF